MAVATLVSLAGLLDGCANNAQPAPVCNLSAINAERMMPDPIGPLAEVPPNSTSIIDPEILHKVYVKPITARRTATGTVEVITQLVNCTDYPLQLEGRTQFFESSGLPAEPLTGWKRLQLSPRSYATYQEYSLGRENISSYGLELREGR